MTDGFVNSLGSLPRTEHKPPKILARSHNPHDEHATAGTLIMFDGLAFAIMPASSTDLSSI
jgi:hypothetical protein